MEFSQAKHEEILRNHLSRYDIHVELGIELVGLEQNDGFVIAHLAATVDGRVTQQSGRYAYVVGADGARGKPPPFRISAVPQLTSIQGITRKLINAAFLGETRDADEFIVGDVEVENLSRDVRHTTCTILLLSLNRSTVLAHVETARTYQSNVRITDSIYFSELPDSFFCTQGKLASHQPKQQYICDLHDCKQYGSGGSGSTRSLSRVLRQVYGTD